MNLLLDIRPLPSDLDTRCERPLVLYPLEPAGPSDSGFDNWLEGVLKTLEAERGGL